MRLKHNKAHKQRQGQPSFAHLSRWSKALSSFLKQAVLFLAYKIMGFILTLSYMYITGHNSFIFQLCLCGCMTPNICWPPTYLPNTLPCTFMTFLHAHVCVYVNKDSLCKIKHALSSLSPLYHLSIPFYPSFKQTPLALMSYVAHI